MSQTEGTLCPYLGLDEDSTVASTIASSAHRCYARKRASKPTAEHQTGFCLTGNHTTCPIYVAAAARNVPPPAARTGHTRRTRTGRRLVLPSLVILLTLVAAGWIAMTFGLQAFQPEEVAEATSTRAVAVVVETETATAQAEVATPANTATPTPPQEATTAANEQVTATPQPTNTAPAPTATDAQPVVLVPSPTPIQVADTSDPATSVQEPPPVQGESQTLTISPRQGNAGWWSDGTERRNYVGDSFLYAGQFGGQTYAGAMRFDLGRVPRGAPINGATLEMTGLREDRLTGGASASWLVQFIAESSLDDLAAADFLTLYSAPASITLLPELKADELGVRVTNRWELDATVRRWLEQQLIDGAKSVTVRIVASTEGEDNLFAWDSGLGPETSGQSPVLTLNLGPPPPTPPPLPTVPILIATLTPVPENVLTVVAQAATTTVEAEQVGTATPIPYRIVTPTPFPENLATVQAAARAQDLPPVVLHTPAPANNATATAMAEYATAVAITTGTFTPVPEEYVTPVLVLPSPPAENVATAAARVVAATRAAERGDATPTALPYNAVVAEYVYATETPANAETAVAMVQAINAAASTTGTPTPIPWNAIIITQVPPPTPTPIPLVVPESVLTPTPTPTPTIQAPSELPPELRNKIVFKSDRTGAEQTWAMDPVSGESFLITQQWVHPLAREQLANSPDGNRYVIVQADGNGDLQIKIRSREYGTTKQITNFKATSYDPAWSPNGDRIAFVSTDSGGDEIYTVDPEGQIVTRLTFNAWEWDKHPAWSPDGSQIVFFSNRDSGRRQIWLMNADGSNQRNLSNNDYNDWDPVWTR